MQSERRSSWTLAAFAAPCLPLAGLGLPLVVYLPAFYAGELGLDLAAVGVAFLVVRCLDMAFDPFIGGVMDRTRTRFGRFRLWLVVSVPIIMAAAYALFMAKPGVTVVHLWFWLLVIYAGFSIGTLAQVAWGASLSPDYNQRSRIYAWWQAGNIVGMILVLTLPAAMPLLGFQGKAAGVAAMGWFIVILMPLMCGLAAWRVPEHVITTPAKRAGFAEYLALFRRPTVVRLLIVDLLVSIGPAVTGALFFFFFERLKGFNSGTASQLLLVYFLGGLIGAPIWTRLAFKVSKHLALAASGLFYALVTMAALALPAGNLPLAAIMMFLIGLPYSAGLFLLRAMMADVSDEERLQSGVDRTGLLFAMLSGTVKLASAAAVGVTFPALKALGFDPNAPGESGLTALALMFTIVPAGMALLASAIVAGFPLTPKRHAEIREALHQRDLAEAAPEMGSEPPLAEEIHVSVRPAQ